MFRKTILLFLSAACFNGLFAQEILTGLEYNTRLGQSKPALKASGATTLPLQLPFFEDFRQQDILPASERWSDYNVYINQGFAIYPPNFGVATFDALDSTGRIYAHANYTPFEADRLTSQPIRLDSVFSPIQKALRKSDSLYFSFHYQPQGRGNQPQRNDSLLLFFYNPIDSLWNRVWGAEGMPLDTFYLRYGKWFRQVMIPITDSIQYFHKDFRFRFVNYASLAGASLPAWQSSMDQWNVDYIYLNLNRYAGDTTFRDIGFVDVSPTMLRYYASMPYNQYSDDPSREMNDTLFTVISNMDRVPHLSNYSYTVFDAAYNKINTYTGGSYPIYPVYDSGYVSYTPYARPRITTILPIDPLGVKDSADFIIRHVLVGDYSPGDRLFDTLEIRQSFRNYYAYDDGIPEAGYGLTPAGSMGAVRFTLNMRDTVRAVNIFFNPTRNQSNQQYFHLGIWDDNNGLPDKLLGRDTIVKPEFITRPHGFQTFVFKEPVPVRNAFFVGWITTTNDNLNMGFDFSRSSRQANFYNIDGQWRPSQYEGSIMIRPVLGKPIHKTTPGIKISNRLVVSPNPLDGRLLGIVPPQKEANQDFSGYSVEVVSLAGQIVAKLPYSSTIDLGHLTRGMYIVRLMDENGRMTATTKLVVSR